MKIITFLRRELTLSFRLLALIAGISGLSCALILAVINKAAEQANENVLSFVPVFITLVTAYIFSQRYLLLTTANHIEEALHRIRVRIVAKIQDAELLTLERIGQTEIYTGITKELQSISRASLVMVLMVQSLILMFFALIYISIQSLLALILYAGLMTMIGIFSARRYKRVAASIHDSLVQENVLLEATEHLLHGFKEVKMSEARRTDLNRHITEASHSAVDLIAESNALSAGLNILAQTSLYLSLAVLVFILPAIISIDNRELVKLTSAVLFLVAPLVSMLAGMQMYTGANVSAERIDQLEAAIDRHVRPMAKRRGDDLVMRDAPFRDIAFQDVQFDYVDPRGGVTFRLGPLNLVITSGETLFISGGNGSGKSTFLRLLTSLYFPTRGTVQVDGQRLSESNAAAYRELFGVIFYDYHLFDRLYGLRHIDENQVDTLLQRFRLADKTRFKGDRFETLDLSTGQRRRLALVVHYLEDKPICVFDEWAAEQDPDFRRYFYTCILPELKAQGKTVIAVTHDDRYYDLDYVDRIIRFEEGQVVMGAQRERERWRQRSGSGHPDD